MTDIEQMFSFCQFCLLCLYILLPQAPVQWKQVQLASLSNSVNLSFGALMIKHFLIRFHKGLPENKFVDGKFKSLVK